MCVYTYIYMLPMWLCWFPVPDQERFLFQRPGPGFRLRMASISCGAASCATGPPHLHRGRRFRHGAGESRSCSPSASRSRGGGEDCSGRGGQLCCGGVLGRLLVAECWFQLVFKMLGLPWFLSPMLLDLVPGTRSSNKVGPIQLATDLWWSQGCNRSSHQSEARPVRVGTLAEAKAELVEAISCCDSLEAFRSFGGQETGGKLDSSCTICWSCLDFYASEGEPDGRGTSGNSWLPSWIASLNGFHLGCDVLEVPKIHRNSLNCYGPWSIPFPGMLRELAIWFSFAKKTCLRTETSWNLHVFSVLFWML